MHTRVLVLTLSAWLAIFSTAAAGQKKSQDDTGTRSVEGTVTDANKGPVSGAVVLLKDTKTLQIRSVYTQTDGTYHFAGLSTNVDYELTARRGSESSASKTLSNFDSHKVAKMDLKLKGK